MNEEEIKIKYVLPWLKDSGLDLKELQFERTFSLKVGRQWLNVGPVSREVAGARLDILVRREGRNLLIVETKAEHAALTDDDRDQAISYARLVHPIAPYAVVTNGNEYRLYDTISKKQVSASEIQIRGFEAALPDEAIVEAQRIFLGLNPKNLWTFCQGQVAGQMRVVKGTVREGRKYVPELHVPREVVLKEVSAPLHRCNAWPAIGGCFRFGEDLRALLDY